MPESPRYYLPDAEIPLGFSYPQEYIDFVEKNKSLPIAMIGMPPWIFAGDMIWAKNESVAELGALLVPFAQAENMDMVSYFDAFGGQETTILVANPWDARRETRIYEKLRNFSEWLNFARRISNDLLLEKPHMKQKKFWFPDAEKGGWKKGS